MAAKRPAGEDISLPPAKKPVISQTPLPLLPATSQEDLDVKILQVNNHKIIIYCIYISYTYIYIHMLWLFVHEQ